ncbi:MAG: PilZ domain-containing protein [Candidatus Omnitrophica bacterium]|nr:PilZ domain-containing protein [Candidatus Omnitrophota bacterium]
MQKDNRRAFERFEVEFPVEAKQVKEGESSYSQCVDASASGLGVFTQRPFITNFQVEIWVKIPDGHEPLYGLGRVVWSKQVDEGRWRIGVQLKDINLMGMRRLLPNSLDN